MPKRTNPYQELVFKLESALAPTGARVVQSALLTDRSGTQREVDVLIEGDVGGHSLRIAVECRTESRPQDVTWVDELLGKYAGLDVQRVVAVSRSGFSRSALSAIESSRGRITALTFNDALVHDWRKEVAGLVVALTVVTVQALEATVVYAGDALGLSRDELMRAELEAGSGRPSGSVKQFAEQQGRAASNDLVATLFRTHPDSLPTEFSFCVQITDDSLLVRHLTEARAIVEVRLRLTVRVDLHPVALQRHLYRDTRVTTGEVSLGTQKYEISLVHAKRDRPPLGGCATHGETNSTAR